MKKAVIMLLLAELILLGFISCTRETEGYSIIDALKISAYLFDESIDINEPIYYEWGETVYTLERLKKNEIRAMAPQGEMRDLETGGEIPPRGLVLFLEFDGIIELVAENRDIRFERHGITGHDIQLAVGGHVSVFPLRFVTNEPKEVHTVKPGTEYYIDINAYKFDNEGSPVIRARLKLVALRDAITESEEVHFGGEPRSCCMSVELISYEYSDVYKMMYEIGDGDDN